MNGQVTKVKGSGKKQIEPGCEIIVPSKAKKNTNIGNSFSDVCSIKVDINKGIRYFLIKLAIEAIIIPNELKEVA